MRLIGIETSCDETAIGVVEEGRHILGHAVASSLKQHSPYGGVIPEIAARVHVESIWQVLDAALSEANVCVEDVDAIAVTHGPGLPGALHIGVAFAKGLSLSLDRPLIPVDHLAAHLYAGEMSEPTLQVPYIGLVVSGGHSLLCVVHGEQRFELLGETKDDAVGEAFDKVAKLLGLGYPGGPLIDRLSESGNRKQVVFPRTQTKQPFDFSFSGLKTSVYHYVQKHTTANTSDSQLQSQSDDGTPSASDSEGSFIADVAASFQEAAVDVLVNKTFKAVGRTGIREIVVGGGVAANCRLRERFAEEAASKKCRVVFPPPHLCVDNGIMVAGLGFRLLQQGKIAPLSLRIDPNLCLVG